MREMGMNTEAAPSSVRVGEIDTSLYCSGADGSLELALEGPGEAVLLAFVGQLPLMATASTWERRAVSPDRLPAIQPGRCRDLRALWSGSA